MSEKFLFVSSSGFVNIELTMEQALSASHPGQCTPDVKVLSEDPEVQRQLKAIDPSQLYAELAEYGTWDDVELQDYTANLQRILWLAANDIVENN